MVLLFPFNSLLFSSNLHKQKQTKTINPQMESIIKNLKLHQPIIKNQKFKLKKKDFYQLGRLALEAISSKVAKLQWNLSLNLKLAAEIIDKHFSSLINIIVLIRRIAHGSLKRSTTRPWILMRIRRWVVFEIGASSSQSRSIVEAQPFTSQRTPSHHRSNVPPINVII